MRARIRIDGRAYPPEDFFFFPPLSALFTADNNALITVSLRDSVRGRAGRTKGHETVSLGSGVACACAAGVYNVRRGLSGGGGVE